MLQLDKPKPLSCIPRAFAILLIPFLFIVGLVLAYMGIFPLKVETYTLGIVIFIFIVYLFFVKHNAYYAVCYIKGTFSQMEEALQEALDENALTIMGKTKSTLNIKEFISEYYQDLRNDNFARVAPSVFPMLGILGTFIAIALSMPDFTVQDSKSLDSEISLLLSGIGTAFYASIYGIMLSLVWTYFEKRGIAKADKQVNDLEKMYRGRIWKKAELIKHEHMQSELKNQEIIQTLKEIFHMDFIKELNEQYIKNFTTIIHDTTNSFTKLTEQMQETSKSLRNTLETIESKKENVTAVSVMLDNMSGFNTTAQNLEKTMNRFDSTVDHNFDKIDHELSIAVEKLSMFARIVSEQNQLIFQNIANFREEKEEKR